MKVLYLFTFLILTLPITNICMKNCTSVAISSLQEGSEQTKVIIIYAVNREKAAQARKKLKRKYLIREHQVLVRINPLLSTPYCYREEKL